MKRFLSLDWMAWCVLQRPGLAGRGCPWRVKSGGEPEAFPGLSPFVPGAWPRRVHPGLSLRHGPARTRPQPPSGTTIMSDQANTADVLVISMGPVGLHQIFQLGLLGLRVAAVDSLPELGGQCRALYADKLIHDIPGLPMVSAQQLSDNLFQQIQPLYPDLHFGQVAQALRPWQEDGVRRGFELTTQTGLCLHAWALRDRKSVV